MTAQSFDIPRALRRGGKLNDVETSVQSTLAIIDLMYRKLKMPDFSQAHILDMGCGWRMAKTLLDLDIPVARYVGMDVFADMVEFLQASVTDPRFSFHALDSHNAMYNPQGTPLAELTGLNVPESTFHVICLFSVFTHLAPHDYVAMLKLLRPYVRPDGKLIFSLFVNETTEAGFGFIDNINRLWAIDAAQRENAGDRFKHHLENQVSLDFVDFDPAQPLRWAVFSRDYAIKLVEGTGWNIESLNDPEEAIQHYMVCTPA
jgi:SAM-dependent methyltransferase